MKKVKFFLCLSFLNSSFAWELLANSVVVIPINEKEGPEAIINADNLYLKDALIQYKDKLLNIPICLSNS